MMEPLVIALFLRHFIVPSMDPTVANQSETPVGQGSLIVEVVQAPARTFPPGSQRVGVLSLNLRASCGGDVPVHSITLQRRGMGDRSDIASVYLMENQRRLTTGRELQRDGSALLTLRQWVVPACGERHMEVFIDSVKGAAISAEHWFTISGPSAIEADAASVELLISERTFQSQITAGPAVGTITVSYPRLLETVRYGQERSILRLRLKADGSSDYQITAVTLTNEGSARDDDIQMIFLEAGPGRRITGIAPQLTDETVRLTFDPPFILRKNQERLLTLRADVLASRSRTLRFIVQEPGDLESAVLKGRK